MKRLGTANKANATERNGKYVYGMLYGFGVSLYHVDACIFGCQHRLRAFGPKATTLPTSHAHRVADMTNSNRIDGN